MFFDYFTFVVLIMSFSVRLARCRFRCSWTAVKPIVVDCELANDVETLADMRKFALAVREASRGFHVA